MGMKFMTHTNWTESRPGAGESPGSSEGAFSQENRAAEGLVDDVKAAASGAGSQAKKIATEKADELQGAAASHLRLFADAVRNAGDELAAKESGPVSDLVRRAAEGLEQFSGALGRKSSAEMIDSVRDFGRQNPVGFLAGSMLAGFALARFAGSAAPRTDDESADQHARTGEYGAWNEEWDSDQQDTLPEESLNTAHEQGDVFPNQESGEAGAVSGANASVVERPRDASFVRNWRNDV